MDLQFINAEDSLVNENWEGVAGAVGPRFHNRAYVGEVMFGALDGFGEAFMAEIREFERVPGLVMEDWAVG